MLLGCGHREGGYDYPDVSERNGQGNLLPCEKLRNKEILKNPKIQFSAPFLDQGLGTQRTDESGEGRLSVANNLDGTRGKKPKIRTTKRNRTKRETKKDTDNSRGKLNN